MSLHEWYNWWNGVEKVKLALKKEANPLRIGVLSAAAINYSAIFDPVATHPGAIFTALGARDKSRAQAQIDKNKLGPQCKAYGSYDELLASPDVDAVYIPLPNGLHAQWAVKAMEAGKHVLIEKPIAANADEGCRVKEAAATTGLVALEAFHWRLGHPSSEQVKSIIQSGKYGKVVSVYSSMKLPKGAVPDNDIRVNWDLAGGACMDLTYVFSACTFFAGCDITQSKFDVLSAKPTPFAPNPEKVDIAMDSKFTITAPDGNKVYCHVEANMANDPIFFGLLPNIPAAIPFASIELEKAKIDFTNFVIPHYYHNVTITEKETGKKTSEKFYIDNKPGRTTGQPWWTTYRWQLETFVNMIKANKTGKPYQGPGMSMEESEKLMELIDSVYDKSGLPRRGT